MAEPVLRCVELVETVTDWMEGAVDDQARLQLDEHLVICPHCAEYVAQLRATSAVLAIARTPEAPPAAVRVALLVALRSTSGR